MDLVTCEAPLDNSFQKDRRELVNKGSLGRRRKPSRSNLKLILSPQQDTPISDIQHYSNGTQENILNGSLHQENGIDHCDDTISKNSFQNIHSRDNLRHSKFDNLNNEASKNYSQVIASLAQLNKHCDINANNQLLNSNIQKESPPRTLLNNNISNGDVKIRCQPKNSNVKSYTTENQYQNNTCNNYSNHVKVSFSSHHNRVISNNQLNKQAAKKDSESKPNVITFSNRRQIVTSTPIQSKKTHVSKETKYNGVLDKGNGSKIYTECRLSPIPPLVAEAQQFSIESKRRRKKADGQGRSAVLIQTWERRTQSDSLPEKLQDSSKSLPKNRFGSKDCANAMPDSYICNKYKGSLQNGDIFREDKMVSKDGELITDDKMLYRVTEPTSSRTTQTLKHSNCLIKNTSSSYVPTQEPEWVSLSRKLCAKFVEGHIEPHSLDTNTYTERQTTGFDKLPSPSPMRSRSNSTPYIKEDKSEKKKIVLSSVSTDNLNTTEPPWVDLSRKLCTKFIEQHIEYPPISNGHFVAVPELLAPNGDVRIIEKVGKPKKSKMKKKKEAEPEWVSLSKKLRAKFIESHIDDPDTIALDNQLNASDPEETSSESLSDISQEIPLHKTAVVDTNDARTKSHITFERKRSESASSTGDRNSSTYPEKECCWEYQEMEFDQESNSGNFQDPAFYEEAPQQARVQRGFLPEDEEENSKCFQNSEAFGNSIPSEKLEGYKYHPQDNGHLKDSGLSNKSGMFQTAECFNNDVKFESSFNDMRKDDKQNKLITIQFISNGNNQRRSSNEFAESPASKPKSVHGSFFNLSTWEEAHYAGARTDNRLGFESVKENTRSKSLDNLCDSMENEISSNTHNKKEQSIKLNSNSSINLNLNGNIVDIRQKNIDVKEMSTKENLQTFNNELCSNESLSEEMDVAKNRANPEPYRNAEIKHAINSHHSETSSDDEVFVDSCQRNIHKNFDSNRYEKTSGHVTSNYEQNGYMNGETCSKEHKKSDVKSSSKCNGLIPNSLYSGLPENHQEHRYKNQKEIQSGQKKSGKLGMSKWITLSKSEKDANKNEFNNTQPSIQNENHKHTGKFANSSVQTDKYATNKNQSKPLNKNNSDEGELAKFRQSGTAVFIENERLNETQNSEKKPPLNCKSKSLCDITFNNDSGLDTSFKYESVVDLSSASKNKTHPKFEFQYFESESDIPLCAKLVSRQDRMKESETFPTKRSESPCPSESSHVYEDMFKETPSGPSDSEVSSWTAMKGNTYYVNGRSSSMNDLDFSDSCSMSVKCEYASSSEDSTLQSRQSSYASSSFYVNLRDYDSHMLEPSLNKPKDSTTKMTVNGRPSISKSNPPTPESLRHLFTSPLSSIHSPPNRTSRLITRMPSDPQSHYYSTAAATSSAFKHGFSVTSPKISKKSERSSSLKIKDIAQGIILTFKKFQNHSKSSHLSPAQYVDVSHLAEMQNERHHDSRKPKKLHKEFSKSHDKIYWSENSKNDSDSGFLSDVQKAKARRSSSDLTGLHSNSEFSQDKKKSKLGKKSKDKSKKNRGKIPETRAIPTVSREVQQMADGTLYLVTTVSGDTAMPGVYSDSPDTSSEISCRKSVKLLGESNC